MGCLWREVGLNNIGKKTKMKTPLDLPPARSQTVCLALEESLPLCDTHLSNGLDQWFSYHILWSCQELEGAPRGTVEREAELTLYTPPLSTHQSSCFLSVLRTVFSHKDSLKKGF